MTEQAATFEVKYTVGTENNNLAQAIRLRRRVRDLEGPDSILGLYNLHALANTLVLRFRVAHDRKDLEEAIAAYRVCQQTYVATDPNRLVLLGDLARAIEELCDLELDFGAGGIINGYFRPHDSGRYVPVTGGNNGGRIWLRIGSGSTFDRLDGKMAGDRITGTARFGGGSYFFRLLPESQLSV